jgi:hypothetical protein
MFLTLLYACVLALTVLRQFPQISASRLLRWDSVGFVPGFSFFAPNPGSHDYVLVYRTFTNGLASYWKDPLDARPRSLTSAIWNPNKRVRKAMIDLSGSLAHSATIQPNSNDIMLSIPYLLMLHHVSRLASHDKAATKVQFALLTAAGPRGTREVEMLFSSAIHDLDA